MNNEKKVLVVDDSDDLSQVIADFLSMFGYGVQTARDGYDALDCLRQTPVDIVVSDIHMPRMDGLALMSEIRKTYLDIPVILITGYGVDAARKRALDLGASAFVAKPFHLRELKDVIDSAFDHQEISEAFTLEH
ncbi:MAG: response regulator [Thermodesulfobacteriota bacterium]|nr:response regulator [Thermodesulfobacteriota bacterium]